MPRHLAFRLRLTLRALPVALLLCVLLLGRRSPPARGAQEDGQPVPALLDGVLLPASEGAAVNAGLPLAVMVDNLPDGARPQFGLDRADIVYELLVEGGITRFMAVYLRQEAERVEPVRSVRTPYLYLAAELGAVIAHVGAAETPGPADAGTQMREWGIRDLDEPRNPAPFWRDRTRLAPHNAAVSTAALRAEADARGWDVTSPVDPWLFKDDLVVANASDGVAGRIAFAWTKTPQRAFAVEWQFDPEIDGYRRWMGGAPHVDARTGETLSAKNVIVQFDSAEVVDDEGHVIYGSVGSGPAWVFLDSQVIPATWTKPDRESRTRYWDAEGVEIRLNRGPTWVAVLPYGSPLEWD